MMKRRPGDVAIFDGFAVAGDGEEAEVRRTLPTAAETMAVQRAADAAMRSAMEMGVAQEVAEQIRLATLAVASYEEPPRVHEPLGGGDNLSKAAGPLETSSTKEATSTLWKREALKDAVCTWQPGTPRGRKGEIPDDKTTNPLLGDKLSLGKASDALRIRISGNEVENEEGERRTRTIVHRRAMRRRRRTGSERRRQRQRVQRAMQCDSQYLGCRKSPQALHRRRAPRVSQPIPGSSSG